MDEDASGRGLRLTLPEDDVACFGFAEESQDTLDLSEFGLEAAVLLVRAIERSHPQNGEEADESPLENLCPRALAGPYGGENAAAEAAGRVELRRAGQDDGIGLNGAADAF
jgi:hypothetical protein